ncbi:MAG: hypothetical protein R3F49_06100 [Planctomycetota bacterium]
MVEPRDHLERYGDRLEYEQFRLAIRPFPALLLIVAVALAVMATVQLDGIARALVWASAAGMVALSRGLALAAPWSRWVLGGLFAAAAIAALVRLIQPPHTWRTMVADSVYLVIGLGLLAELFGPGSSGRFERARRHAARTRSGSAP